LLKIKTTHMMGNIADVRKCSNTEFRQGILLLPIDILFGWIFTNDKRQRLLSKAGYTIVIKAQEEDIKWSYTKCQTQNVRHRKE
jgi:hypothetical protein